jgi:hypothetical protein
MRHVLLLLLFLTAPLLAEHSEATKNPNSEPKTARPVVVETPQASKPMTMEEALRQDTKNLLVDPETHELTSSTGKSFKISLLTEEQAAQIFKDMAEQKNIPFCYPEDGCYARAHKMTQLMEKKGFIAGKVFLEGDLKVETKNSPKGFVEWWYHVAPLVAVKQGKKVELLVIDPSLVKGPLKLDDWINLQTSHLGGKKDSLYHTPRFNYTPSDKNQQRKDYDNDDKEDTQKTLERYLKIQKERSSKKD